MTSARKCLALVGFAAGITSTIVYLASFFGFTLEGHGRLFVGLHAGAFVLLVPMFLLEYSSMRQRRFFWNGFGAAMPSWAVPTIKVLGGLAIAHFLLFLLLTRATSPKIKDGQYVLDDHGRTAKILTEDEYVRLKGWELRMFAAYWLFFYTVAVLYWWFPRGARIDTAPQIELTG